MKNFFFSILLAAGIFSLMSFGPSKSVEPTQEIKWYTWQEAMEANQKEPKKMFIDMYTDWCGWCKKMDASTFKDPEVIKYMNDNFYAIKFNAEQKEEVIYDDHKFEFVKSGRRGYHQLAAALLDGQMGYPSFVYMDEEERRITISPGYKDAKKLLLELNFIAGDHYKEKDLEGFAKEYNTLKP